MPSGARRKYSENREALRHFDLIGLATKMFDFTFLLIMWAAALRRGRIPPPPHPTLFILRRTSCLGHISAVRTARRTIIESFVQGKVYPMSLMYTLFIFILVLVSPFFFGFLAIIPAFIHDFLINAANSMKTKKEEDNEDKDDKSIEMTTMSTEKKSKTT